MRENWEINWKDYYRILQIHPFAEHEVVVKAYKVLAEKYHPDKNPATSQIMKDLNEAFEILGNGEKRSRYYTAYQRRTTSDESETKQKASSSSEDSSASRAKHDKKKTKHEDNKKKRKRGTLLVHSHGKFLLVLNRGHHRWSLPGGGVEKGEKSFQTAIRELHEELGLTVRKLHWLGHFEGSETRHSIYLSNHIKGNIHLQKKELKNYVWWDGKSKINAFKHVWKAVEMAKYKKLI
jgi:curved DNA-binding protein CbpA